jgi:ectoine hydroxylase-related dioxygenase (phytanoyl-CoA dioxygenase family)
MERHVALGATAENGAMRMVPGSHLWPDATQTLEEIADYAADGRALPGTFEGHAVREVDCPVQKGYVHFHSGSAWHCSLPNWTHAPRCAIALFYVVRGARFDGANRWAKDYEGEHGQLLEPAYYPLVEVS